MLRKNGEFKGRKEGFDMAGNVPLRRVLEFRVLKCRLSMCTVVKI